MRKLLEKYLNEVLTIKAKIIPLRKSLLQALPLFLTSSYDAFETTVFEQTICLLLAKNKTAATPDNLLKQKLLIEKTLAMPAVFVFEKVVSYNVKRFIQKKINFIVPNKQMFVPDLMLDLRKMPATLPPKAENLTPIAQLLLLFHLQKELLNSLTIKQLAEKFKQSYLNINRAVNCLKEFGLADLVGGKEKQFFFKAKGKNLWQQAHLFFQNPVERNVFTDEILTANKSNINALAHYTMLNDEQKVYYALDRQEFKNQRVETNKYAGDNVIEIWRYSPQVLAENGFVDKLSLYLLLKNTDNERIEIELETLLEGIKWLEE